MEGQSAEREDEVAHNELAFRRANESLIGSFSEGAADEPHPFLCECGDEGCTTVVLASLAEYEAVREHPAWFVIARGHRRLASERIVEDKESFQIVEKTGRAGVIARSDWPSRATNGG